MIMWMQSSKPKIEKYVHYFSRSMGGKKNRHCYDIMFLKNSSKDFD